jgi:protein TonB
MQDWYNQDHLAHIKRQRRRILTSAILLSVIVHFFSYLNLDWLALRYQTGLKQAQQEPVKVKIVSKPNTKTVSDLEKTKIVETPLTKTERPENPKFSSFQDHKTERETRVDVKRIEQGKNAGEKGRGTDPKLAQKNLATTKPMNTSQSLTSPSGRVSISRDKDVNQPRKAYQNLLPSSKDLSGLADSGFQQQLNEDIDLSDRIDINTSEYRYMGYMTGMRKAIELVWIYPNEAAQRGMQGEVTVEFVIAKSGRVSRIKVLKSSGYRILDDGIVEALKLASPFSPLPDGFGKEKILITGSFNYILSPYVAGAH